MMLDFSFCFFTPFSFDQQLCQVEYSCLALFSFQLFIYLFNLNVFILIGGWIIYNIVSVLPYINMNPPQVYTCSPSWIPLPPPSLYHPAGSSQCTSPKHPVSCIEPGLAILRKLWYIYTMEYYSAIRKNTFESVLMRWIKLEPIIQSEVRQKEKHQYSILTHVYGI